MLFRSCGRKTRLGYHRRPARADTAKTLNFVAKAPTALAHANFTMLRRRASPACPNHPPPVQPLANLPALARNSLALQTMSVAFPHERRGRQDSLVQSWDEEEKPFRCSTGRCTMHLRPHSLSPQSPGLSLLHSTSWHVALLTRVFLELLMESIEFCSGAKNTGQCI